MPKYSAAALSQMRQFCLDAVDFLNDHETILTPTSENRGTRQAQLVVKNVFGVGSQDAPSFINTRCKIADECDIRPSQQLANDFNYFKNTFMQLKFTIDDSIGSGSLNNSQIAKLRGTFNGFSSWLGNLLDGYLRDAIPARRLDNGQPARYTDLWNQLVINAVCALPVSEQTQQRVRSLASDGVSMAALLDSPTPDASKPLTPITVPQEGSKKLLDQLDKIYSAQNDHFYVVITKSTQASANTVAIIGKLKEQDDQLEDILYRVMATADNSDYTRTELKEARQGIKDLLGLSDEVFYDGSVGTKQLYDYSVFAHESENNSLFEIRTRCEEIRDFVDNIRDDTADLPESVADILERLTNLQTDMDKLGAALAQMIDIQQSWYNDLVSRINALQQ